MLGSPDSNGQSHLSTPTAAPAPLGYAGLDADGLPSSIPEVDAAIEQGAKPRQLLKRFREHFKRPRSLQLYLAKFFRNRFPAAGVDGCCVGCGEQTDYIATVQWRIPATQQLTSFRLSWNEAAPPVIRTNHAWCLDCVAKWMMSIRVPMWVASSGKWLSHIAIVIFVGSILYRSVSARLPIYAVYFSLLVVAWMLRGWGASLFYRRTPRRMTNLMPAWLRFDGLDQYDTREERVAIQDAEAVG